MNMRTRVTRAALAATLTLGSVLALDATLGATPAEAADVAGTSCAAATAGPTATTPALTSFTPTSPRRLVDTRTGIGGVDQPVGAGCSLRLDVGAAGLPADAEAFALSITAISTGRGFLTVYPCAGGVLETSNLNTRDRFPTPNLAVAIPDERGRICIFSDVRTELIVDVTGWWTETGTNRFDPIEPKRVEDTRERPGSPLVPANSTHVIDLSDEVPDGTAAIVANLTIAGPMGRGFSTAYPCGTDVPNTSNVNVATKEARASAIIVGLDAQRRLCVTTTVDAHVIVDLAGYYEPTPFGPAASLVPVAGERVADSRDGTGGWSTFGAGTIRRLAPVAGRPDADRVTAVVLNVVAVRAQAPGFVEVYPCDADDPETSVVNFTTDGATSNLATVELSSSGEICVFTFSPTDVVVDMFGVLVAPDDALAERLTFNAETWPPYTADGSDYAVRCPDVTRLELELLPGTSATVNGVPVASGSIRLGSSDGSLASVRLSRSGTSTTHWFRCVPDDFPHLEVERSGATTPGWYLTMLYTPGGAHSYATIMDGRGAPVWYQATDPSSIEFHRRADGLFVGVAQIGPRYGVDPDAGYEVFTLTGQVVDRIVTVDEGGVEHPTDHHDIASLPGGGSAVLTYPLLGGQDLSEVDLVDGSDGLVDDVIADNVIQELDAAGNLMPFTWRASDHFSYDEATYARRFPPVPGWYEGDEVDPWHINSLHRVTDGSGDYVASARHLDAVFRIDRATGDVEWILGPPEVATIPNKSGARRLEVVGDPLGGPRRQHDARLEGNVLTMLDNRTDTGQPARAVAYEIDTVAGTATLLWSIETSSGSSAFGLGSYRIADDGSSLVSWGNGPQPLFEEFDASRMSVLRFFQPGGYSYRITKEPISRFSAALLRATAGRTIG